MNWLQRVVAQLTDEDFITEDGESLFADGDLGEYNHDMRAMEHIIYMSLDDAEELESFNAEDLSDEHLAAIERHFPGFTELVWGQQLLPKEFAVLRMGWIRVHGNHFELQKVDNNALGRIADYVYERTEGVQNMEIIINEQSTGNFVAMQSHDLATAIQSGQAYQKYMLLLQRPEGLY